MRSLFIDPSGGFAGDMFSAALISAGANRDAMINKMLLIAHKIGNAKIKIREKDNSEITLKIELEANHNHLSAIKAKKILNETFEEIYIEKKYVDFGNKILDVLIKAEGKAHSEHELLKNFHQHHGNEVHLHEAQDILIDIIGAVIGMQNLEIDTYAGISNSVSVGGGKVTFSHGTLSVPAPATEIILKEYNIEWKPGPLKTELCTPTGAAILAALNVKIVDLPEIIKFTGFSRGTKDLDIPPLKILIN